MVFRFSQAVPANSVDLARSALRRAFEGASRGPGALDDVLPSDHSVSRELAPVLVSAVRAHPELETSIYPAAFSAPAFHRYGVATSSAAQLARPLAGANPPLRADLSILLWLSDKTAYDGGEVSIDEGGAVTRWSGEAGDAIAYSGGARRIVGPITRGELLVGVLEVQSLIVGELERRILFDFNRALREFERRPPSAQHARAMRRVYNGLVRMWAELPRRSSGP
jgi:PKHD-type hydroxylase